MSGGEWGLVLAHAAVALISYAIPWVDHRPAYYLKLQELSATGASLRSLLFALVGLFDTFLSQWLSGLLTTKAWNVLPTCIPIE
jgi:sugar phosphate permease